MQLRRFVSTNEIYIFWNVIPFSISNRHCTDFISGIDMSQIFLILKNHYNKIHGSNLRVLDDKTIEKTLQNYQHLIHNVRTSST